MREVSWEDREPSPSNTREKPELAAMRTCTSRRTPSSSEPSCEVVSETGGAAQPAQPPRTLGRAHGPVQSPQGSAHC